MKKGTEWRRVKVYDDEDNCQEYFVKLEYEYEGGYYEDGRYHDGYSRIEVLQYPEGISEETKKDINEVVQFMLEEILNDNDDDENEYRKEAERENEICNNIDNSFLNP